MAIRVLPRLEVALSYLSTFVHISSRKEKTRVPLEMLGYQECRLRDTCYLKREIRHRTG